MKHFHIDVQVPNDERGLASALRLIEIEDFVFKSIDPLSEEDRVLLRAQYILAHKRRDMIIAKTRGPIFGYPPTTEDRQVCAECCRDMPNREVFDDAASLISCLDRMPWDHGQATVDEITEAIGKVVRQIFLEAMK